MRSFVPYISRTLLLHYTVKDVIIDWNKRSSVQCTLPASLRVDLNILFRRKGLGAAYKRQHPLTKGSHTLREMKFPDFFLTKRAQIYLQMWSHNSTIGALSTIAPL